MKIYKAEIEDILLIEPDEFSDHRGYFLENFRQSWLTEQGLEIDFVQDNVSKSKKNVLRGLHYQIQNPQDKLVHCVSGSILDVAVDIRKDSKTFGTYVMEELSEENHRQMFIPKGFAHGFLAVSESAVVAYKCSDYYNREGERSIRWNDPDIGIDWPVNDPVISAKDRLNPFLKQIEPKDLF